MKGNLPQIGQTEQKHGSRSWSHKLHYSNKHFVLIHLALVMNPHKYYQIKFIEGIGARVYMVEWAYRVHWHCAEPLQTGMNYIPSEL